jgi:hypothetical protein
VVEGLRGVFSGGRVCPLAYVRGGAQNEMVKLWLKCGQLCGQKLMGLFCPLDLSPTPPLAFEELCT